MLEPSGNAHQVRYGCFIVWTWGSLRFHECLNVMGFPTDSSKRCYTQSQCIQLNLMKSKSSCSISMPSQLHTNQGTHDKLFMTRHSKTEYFNKKMNQKQCLRLASFVPVPFIPFFVSLFPGTTASRLLDAWCVDRLGVSGSPDSVLLQILSDHKKNHLTNVGHERCCQNANPHDI